MSITNLFNDVSLYSKEKFKIFEKDDQNNYILNKEILDNFFNYLGLADKRLITKCRKCGKEYPFEVDYQILDCKGDYMDYTNGHCITIASPIYYRSKFA